MKIALAAVALGFFVVACEGPMGPPGPAGAMGDPGRDDTGSKIVASIYCGGVLEGTPLRIDYKVAQFANGNVFASGDVYGSATSGSDSTIFSPEQVGYDVAPVFISWDAYGTANYGFWRLSLDRRTLVTSIQYNDGEVPGGKDVWAFRPDQCVVDAY